MENERSPEAIRFSTETVSGTALFEEIYHNGEYDSRFLPVEQGGVFHYSPVGLFTEIHKPEVYYSLLRLNDLIVGVGELQFSPLPAQEGVLWFKAISIDENLKGEGYSESLLREIFRFAKSHNAPLWISRPTKEGKERTRYKLPGLAEEFGVQIFNSRGEPFTD